MLLVVFQSVVQQHAQRHDAAVKFAVLGGPVGVHDDGGLIGEDVAPFSALPLQLLQLLLFLLLTEEQIHLKINLISEKVL